MIKYVYWQRTYIGYSHHVQNIIFSAVAWQLQRLHETIQFVLNSEFISNYAREKLNIASCSPCSSFSGNSDQTTFKDEQDALDLVGLLYTFVM